METDLFDYHLPKDMIAQEKSQPRDMSRLFYVDLSNGTESRRHLRFRDLLRIIETGDVLVLNRSRVIPARIPVRKGTGGKVEVLLLEESEEGWKALIGGKGIRPGAFLNTGDPEVRVLVIDRVSEGIFTIRIERGGSGFSGESLFRWLDSNGLVPTPPYIKGVLKDPTTYQTVYSSEEGSVAAPTAGLHFTPEMLSSLRAKGVEIRYVVLHVGYGTFAPIKTGAIEEHTMDSERYWIPPETVSAIEKAAQGPSRQRIWAVGTTVMRTLETAFERDGICHRPEGRSELFITPGYDFKLPYKGFITNFHLPRSTPLVLVSSFWERERVLDAYEEAKGMGYRFYSLGDSMAIRRG